MNPVVVNTVLGVLIATASILFVVLWQSGSPTQPQRESRDPVVVGTTAEVKVRKKTKNDDLCGICFENLMSPELWTLTCQHNFHRACLKKWFTTQERKTCPYCRSIADKRHVSRILSDG